MDTDDIETALAPLLRAREALGTQIGQLAAIGTALVIRQELPGAAHTDLEWTSDGDAAFLRPAGAFYDANGAQIHVPDQTGLHVRILHYCSLLDETNTDVWGELVSEDDANGLPLDEDIRRFDVAAALKLAAAQPPASTRRPPTASTAAAPNRAGGPRHNHGAHHTATGAGSETGR